jgi:hypothetical protein
MSIVDAKGRDATVDALGLVEEMTDKKLVCTSQSPAMGGPR